MLIAFEGCDGAGSTTLSVLFQQYLNEKFRNSDKTLKIDPHLGDFFWTKEPLFTSEEAHNLNSGKINEFERERAFFESRIQHQDIISCKNVVCDHYIWCGLTYASYYSPNCYEFAKELYLSETLFVQPDLYIFVDTPLEVCFDRKPENSMDKLKAIKAAYARIRRFIKAPVLVIQSIGTEEQSLSELIAKFEEYVSVNNIIADPIGW